MCEFPYLTLSSCILYVCVDGTCIFELYIDWALILSVPQKPQILQSFACAPACSSFYG